MSSQEPDKVHGAVLAGTRLTPAEALERARRAGKKPRGTPRDLRLRLEPGHTLAEAVIEDRR